MRFRGSLFALPMALACLAAHAASPGAPRAVEVTKPAIEHMVELPIEGLRAVEAKGQLMYVSANGRFVLVGNLVDVWSGKTITTFDEAKDAATKLHIQSMNLGLDTMNTISFGTGPKEVVIFVDPACQPCHELVKQAEGLSSKYTFKLIVVPALGDESNVLAKRLFCAREPSKRLDAFTAGASGINRLAQKSPCDTVEYDKTLLMAQLLHIQGVPFIVSPDGSMGKGRPTDLAKWLGARS